MPEDRKKLLEALVAKRKAETVAPERKKPKPSGVPAAKLSGKGGGSKPQAAWPKGKEHGDPKKKAKRVEKYESEGSEEEEEEEEEGEDEDDGLSESEEDSADDSDEETAKKSHGKQMKWKAPPLKHDAKGPKPTGFDGKGKGKVAGKGDMAGGKTKRGESSDEGVEDGDGGDVSDASGDDDVDPSNILPSKTRRQASQPVRYDLDDGSDDEDDDSDA